MLDPRPMLNGLRPSSRGAGQHFGSDITKQFLELNNLKLFVRSHEVKMNGFEYMHNKKLITIFSAPNYCGSVGNLGAILKFKNGDSNPEIIQFK